MSKIQPKIYDRTKEKSGAQVSSVFTSKCVDNCTGLLTQNPPYSATSSGYDGNFEYLEYKIHSRKPYGGVLPCLHVKNEVENYGSAELVTYSSVSTHRCTDGSYETYTWYDERPDNKAAFAYGYRLPTNIPSDLGQYHREALEFFASGCQPVTANLAVSFTEIGELISLVGTAYKALKKLRKAFKDARLPYSWKAYLRKLSDGGMPAAMAVSGDLADAHLSWSFAIAPLLSEISATMQTITDMEQRIKWFRDNNKQPVPIRYTADLSDSVTLQPVVYPTTPAGEYFTSGSNVTQYSAHYVAFATATYDVSGLSTLALSHRLYKQAFGFNDPLVFLWEKIPFSFVVDWFVSVGNYLASLPSTTVIPYVLYNTGHHLSVVETVTNWHYGIKGTAYTPRLYWQEVTSNDVRRYFNRTPGIPVTLSGIDVSLPGIKQLLLALSLGRKLFFA